MKSVGTKVLVIVAMSSLVFFGLAVMRTRSTVTARIEALTAAQAELALQFDLAIRRYMNDKVRPLVEKLAGKGEFIPEAMSTSYVARSVFGQVQQEFPDYILKFSSDHPRNPANAAGPEEERILQYFRDHPDAHKWAGQVRMNGKDYFVHCIPRRLEAGCLRCHGRPENAPASLRARYGSEAGFFRTEGDVVALDTVGIPADKMNAAIASDCQAQLAILGAGLAIISTIFILVFRHFVGAPLETMASHFQEAAAQPDESAIPFIEVARQDEIGVLARSFNFLAIRLHALHSSLEQRVNERTALLQAEIAERKRMEQDLWATTQRYRILAENIDDVIWTADLDFHWTYVSPSMEKFRGYSADETANQTLDQILTPASAANAWACMASVLAAAAEDDRVLDRSVRFEGEYRCKDGSTKWAEINVTPVRSSEGQLAGMIGVTRDLTGRREAQEELARAKQAAETANRAKSEFLANMSHEIRTPMTAILGYVDLLSEGQSGTSPLGSEQGDPLEVIRRNADHLLCVIDDVLDLSKIEAGKMALEQSRCSPCRIVAEVVSLMKVRAAAKGLNLEVVFDGRIPETIESDPTRLRQILLNLVGNAIKFTETGGVRVRIRFREIAQGRPMVEIEVADTGIGMPEEAREKLFQPFTQADASTTRRFGGTGLGLTISKRLAELLGGDISVDSAVGTGSTFTLKIPPGPLQGVRLMDVPSEGPSIATSPKNAGTRLPEGCRLLLAEDGVDNQRLIALILRKAGAEVVVAQDGQRAVELAVAAHANAEPFHAILMDMQMPVMDGYAATERLRLAGNAIPILALTAHAMDGDRQRCLKAGCNDYLTKPIDRDLLLQTVARFVQGATAPAGERT